MLLWPSQLLLRAHRSVAVGRACDSMDGEAMVAGWGAVVQPAIFSTNLLRNHGAESPWGAAAAWGETSWCLASGWGAEEFGGKPRVIGGCLATPRLRAGAGFTQQPAVVQKRELRGWGLLCRSVLVALVHFSIAAFQINWRVFFVFSQSSSWQWYHQLHRLGRPHHCPSKLAAPLSHLTSTEVSSGPFSPLGRA